jgi:hypothetical protein
MVARGEEEDAVRRARGEEGEEGEGAERSGRTRVAVEHERRVAFVARAVLRAGDLPLQIAEEPAHDKLSRARTFFAHLLKEDRARILQKNSYFSVVLKYRIYTYIKVEGIRKLSVPHVIAHCSHEQYRCTNSA